MIHNNLRKLLSQLACGANSSYPTNYIGLVNIEGTVTESPYNSTAVAANTKTFNPFYYSAISSAQISNKKRSAILSEVNTGSAYSCAKLVSFIGNSVDGEYDYTLGEFVDDDAILYSTSNSYNTRLSAVTTLYNSSNSDITFNEIGLMWKLIASSAIPPYILIKEVLPESITIASGESIAISFILLADVVEE